MDRTFTSPGLLEAAASTRTPEDVLKARDMLQKVRAATREIQLRPTIHLFGHRPFKCSGLAMLGVITNTLDTDEEIDIREGDIEAEHPNCWDQVYVGGEHKGWVE